MILGLIHEGGAFVSYRHSGLEGGFQ